MATMKLAFDRSARRIDADLCIWDAASSGKLRFGKFLARKVPAPPVFE